MYMKEWTNALKERSEGHLSQGMIALKGPGSQLAGNMKLDARLHTDEKKVFNR